MKSPPPKRRNPLYDAPLLRKGGVHDKTNKAKRRKEKMGLRREWAAPSATRWVDRAAHCQRLPV